MIKTTIATKVMAVATATTIAASSLVLWTGHDKMEAIKSDVTSMNQTMTTLSQKSVGLVEKYKELKRENTSLKEQLQQANEEMTTANKEAEDTATLVKTTRIAHNMKVDQAIHEINHADDVK
jgi:predicted  nucleic acid-binding Zn-ribbon protein